MMHFWNPYKMSKLPCGLEYQEADHVTRNNPDAVDCPACREYLDTPGGKMAENPIIRHNTDHIDHILGSRDADGNYTIHCEICGKDIAFIKSPDLKIITAEED